MAISELQLLYTRNIKGKEYNPNGVNIFSEDWDNLLILDACRYDEFRMHSELPGELSYRISRGSQTDEFIRANFGGRALHDVVYVSASPWYAKLAEEIGSKVHSFQYIDRPDEENNWSPHPETVAEIACEWHDEYPNKRLIVHFLQPHVPYYGSTGKKFEPGMGMKQLVQKCNVSRKDIIAAYRENLLLVLDVVGSTIEHFNGKTVITSDHGELLGERFFPLPMRRYGHNAGFYVDELVKVPWHSYQNGERKTITEEPPVHEKQNTSRDIDQHLSNLGYRVD